jgi:hypothetical protein
MGQCLYQLAGGAVRLLVWVWLRDCPVGNKAPAEAIAPAAAMNERRVGSTRIRASREVIDFSLTDGAAPDTGPCCGESANSRSSSR